MSLKLTSHHLTAIVLMLYLNLGAGVGSAAETDDLLACNIDGFMQKTGLDEEYLNIGNIQVGASFGGVVRCYIELSIKQECRNGFSQKKGGYYATTNNKPSGGFVHKVSSLMYLESLGTTSYDYQVKNGQIDSLQSNQNWLPHPTNDFQKPPLATKLFVLRKYSALMCKLAKLSDHEFSTQMDAMVKEHNANSEPDSN